MLTVGSRGRSRYQIGATADESHAYLEYDRWRNGPGKADIVMAGANVGGMLFAGADNPSGARIAEADRGRAPFWGPFARAARATTLGPCDRGSLAHRLRWERDNLFNDRPRKIQNLQSLGPTWLDS